MYLCVLEFIDIISKMMDCGDGSQTTERANQSRDELICFPHKLL